MIDWYEHEKHEQYAHRNTNGAAVIWLTCNYGHYIITLYKNIMQIFSNIDMTPRLVQSTFVQVPSVFSPHRWLCIFKAHWQDSHLIKLVPTEWHWTDWVLLWAVFNQRFWLLLWWQLIVGKLLVNHIWEWWVWELGHISLCISLHIWHFIEGMKWACSKYLLNGIRYWKKIMST